MQQTTIEWTDELRQRFWSYVDTRAPNDCWVWSGGRFTDEYGQFRAGSRKVKSHRIAFELSCGRAVKTGLIVCHSCDNPPCCNPTHLFEGTHKDNAQDREAKGRGARFNLPVLRGEDNPAAKLCSGQVLEIRLLRQSGLSLRAIAHRYCVSVSQVRNIVKGTAWQI